MHTDTYQQFLAGKSQVGEASGFEPDWLPPFLFDFQRHLVEWAVRRGRAALFADCGLGKTPIQLVWAENVVRHTGRPVLILTPLAVSAQTIREADKFGIEAKQSRDGRKAGRITVTNYEQLSKFSPEDYAGVVCDESSVLKHFKAKTKAAVTEFLRTIPYRLLCTATPSPNDYIELGTSSEAIGELGYQDMLTMFFVKKLAARRSIGWGREQYRMKGHAERGFWRWVCSWARAIRKPSDLGDFDDSRFVLPELIRRQHEVKTTQPANGFLFDMPAVTMADERDELRRTTAERCQKVADLVAARDDCSLVFCQLNREGDLLEKLIPGAVQIAGGDSDDWKEAVVEWFVGLRCLCQLKRKKFRAKLAACQENNPTTSGGTTKRTGSGGSPNPASTSGSTGKSGESTCDNTISPTSRNSGGLPTSGSGTTPPAESGTLPTPGFVSGQGPRSSRGRRRIPASDLPSGSEHTASPSPSTSKSSPNKVAGVPSVGGPTQETNADTVSTLTTVTPPGDSAVSSVPGATRDSDTSVMTPNGLSVPQCTCGYVSGKRVLISKPKILCWGLNFAHCAHITFFPSHSFEQVYQAVRRCWRFGQTRPVVVDIITTPGMLGVLGNLKAKEDKVDRMFSRLVDLVGWARQVTRTGYGTLQEVIPSWLSSTSN
jgi:hypothetical protein